MTERLSSLSLPALVGVFITVAALTLTTQWRLRLAILAIQYVLTALIIAQSVIWQVAAVKAAVGLLVVVMLNLTAAEVSAARRAGEAVRAGDERPAWRRIELQTNLPFRVAALLLASVATWYLVTESGLALVDLPLELNLAAVLLIVLGLLGLGLSEEPMNAGIGLLMVLNGFELLYAPVERSLTVVAMLAGVNFGVALAVSHLALLSYAGKGASE